MPTLPLKASRNEQRSVIRFLWANGTQRKCHSLLLGPATIIFLGQWRKCQVGRNLHLVFDTEVQSTVRQRLRQQPASFFCLHQASRNLLTDGKNVQMNLDDTLSNETLMFDV